MKIFLGGKNDAAAASQAAKGCLATNLVMPGLGSLVGGRKIGYVQLAISLTGFTVSLVFGTHFIFWALAHWSEYHGANAPEDPLQPLRDLWREARWPMLGMGLFAVALLWSMGTSRSLLAEAKQMEAQINP
ncbi:MAG: hypothetical protein P4N60_16765 [Verrucomicrobiae bacterium]|nr:hypothetical protein [Verrucomicrobiae bacterium]